MKNLQQFCVVWSVLSLAHFAKGEKEEALKQELSKNQNICKNQPNGAILANANDCHKFYMCDQQKAYQYNCDPAYHYDASTRSCVIGSSCSSDSNKTVTCAEGNIRSVHDDCNVFEACVRGRYKKFNCPASYYFNAQQDICVPFIYDAQFKCNCLMPEYTVLENENNCETYFVCHEKSAVLENCPLGQYYNAELNTCLTDFEGVCLISKQTDEINTDVQAICRNLGLKDIHFQTFPKSCNTFFICVNGQLHTQHCPQHFYYDSDKKYCIMDAINKCSVTENFFDSSLY